MKKEFVEAATSLLDTTIQAALSGRAELTSIDAAKRRFVAAAHALEAATAAGNSVPDCDGHPAWRTYNRVLAAHHEAAHAVVGHLTGMGVFEISIERNDDSFARAWFAKYDEADDGARDSWARRYAVTALAGFSGGLIIAPHDFSPGSMDDFERAQKALKEAGLDPETTLPELQKVAVELVLGARPAVFAIARSLLANVAIDRSRAVAIILGQLQPQVLEKLETRGRSI